MNVSNDVIFSLLICIILIFFETILLPYIIKIFKKQYGRKLLHKNKIEKYNIFQLYCIIYYLRINEKDMLISSISNHINF